jgi:ribosomal protein S18 acetylase RimI-like enzyme
MMVRRQVLSMQRSLSGELPEQVSLRDVRLESFRDAHGPAVHALLQQAYRRGGGAVEQDGQRWLRDFVGDVEFDASTCFLAFDSAGTLVGAALCWDSGFVKDLCVAESFRHRGLGTALLVHAMHTFAARGKPSLRLKVERDNPSNALRLYRKLGFEVVRSTRARSAD